MECKAEPALHHESEDHRFNRDIVECKGRRFFEGIREKLDLIETLWNVKVDAKPL